MIPTLALDRYRLLGRSGLRVSPLALGTMTFGADWGWGADGPEARRIFNAYIERGGNFIDTASVYTNGTAERFLGTFIQGERDRFVIATKYTLSMHAGDANAGGNHRKSMVRSVEGSLRRLNTDYIDLLYLHAWDSTTPVEEVVRAMDDLVRAGKVLYLGVSNLPAWQAARMQTLAEWRGFAPLIALQIAYNLIQRTGERELIPMSQALGMGVIAYSPLAEGILTGKYAERDLESIRSSEEGSRRNVVLSDGLLTQRGLSIARVVRRIAQEIECTPAQVAIAWNLGRVTLTSSILGARTCEQFHQNLRALEVTLTSAQLAELERASAVELGYPHDYLHWLLKSEYMLAAMLLSERG